MSFAFYSYMYIQYHYLVFNPQFEKEVYSIVGSSWRLRGSVQVLSLSRIMLQAETTSQRSMLLQVGGTSTVHVGLLYIMSVPYIFMCLYTVHVHTISSICSQVHNVHVSH